jgi:hypothetical protein
MHISEPVRADLGKLDEHHRAEIRRVASADLAGSDPRGAERPLPAVGMRPVERSRIVAPPAPIMPSVAAASPPADWPTTRSKLSSGLARPGPIGTMPSHEAPRR